MPALGQVVIALSGPINEPVGNVILNFHLGECLRAAERLSIKPQQVYSSGDAGILMRRRNGMGNSAEDLAAASNMMLEMESRMRDAVSALPCGEAEVLGGGFGETAYRMWSKEIPAEVLAAHPQLLNFSALRSFDFLVDLPGENFEQLRLARSEAMNAVRDAAVGVAAELGVKCRAALMGKGELGGMADAQIKEGWRDEENFSLLLSEIAAMVESEAIASGVLPGNPRPDKLGI